MNIHDFDMALHPLLLGDLAVTFRRWKADRQWSAVLLIADENTMRDCAPLFFQKTGISPDVPRHIIPAGEQYKHLGTCERIWGGMFEAHLDRRALVINLGGGVIGDMGGFCAATFKRGIDFLQIPTTLLAATDASVGGKLGVDFQSVKNAIGVFRYPAGVLIDPAFFQTLPERELRSGFAEVIKHAAIGDAALWEMIAPLKQLTQVNWSEILRASVSVKTTVVVQDPEEKGLRAVLNYGHTIGHAIESYFLTTDHPLTHGEAVAWGMVYETRLREQLGLHYGGEKSFLATEILEAYIRRFFVQPAFFPEMFDEIWGFMQQDKKNAGNAVKMSLPGDTPYSLTWIVPSKDQVRTALGWG